MTHQPGTVLEFFAGIGLARMGLERAGWRVVFANDNDPKKRDMHAGHWGHDPGYVLADVHTLSACQLPSAELAWASFPCIDLSLAGNRAGLDGDSSGAYWGFHKLLGDLGERRPPLLVLENVPGMLTSHGGRDILNLLRAVAELGYSVDLLEVDAARFVPQSRPRLFVVGSREVRGGSGQEQAPRGPCRTPRILELRKKSPDLPWFTAPTGELPETRPTLAETLERFPAEADIWWEEGATRKLLERMSARHREAVESAAAQPTISFATVYRRMRHTGYMAEARTDGTAGCLRTPRGGSSRQFVLEMGNGGVRARHMTAVEYGRLQGTNDFRIRVPELQALYGFGDAVCVPVVQWLATSTLNQMSAFRG